MPPLYRMPVFYLAALILATAIGLGSWVRARPAISPGATTAPAPAVAPSAKGPAVAPARPKDDPVADGLRRKGVVKDLDVVCRSDPEGGKPVGGSLDYFAIRFLYGESPPGRPTMLLVGPRQGPPEGWVGAPSVLEWDTRLMARPTPRAGRPALSIYRVESCLLDSLAGRPCPRHHGRCPTAGEEAVGRGAPL